MSTHRAVTSKSGRPIQVTTTTNNLPRTAQLSDILKACVSSPNADALRELTPEMRGKGGVIMDYDFPELGGSLNLKGPPLCIMLHRIKTYEASIQRSIPGVLEVMVKEWGNDPNAEFDVTESWPPMRPGAGVRATRCSAMSWLMNSRHMTEWVFNFDNLQCCIATLISLGADVSLPFELSYANGPSMQNGLSLPLVALRSLKSLECADCLLEGGARFMPTDPSPMCVAMRSFQDDAAVRFFHRHGARIAEGDVLKMDTNGNTAMHTFISVSRRDPRVAVELLDLMLAMGFSPETRRRDGKTALEFAKEQATPASEAIYARLKAVKLAHDREMAVAVQQVMRNTPIPTEIIDCIWERLGYGGVTREHAVRAERRVLPSPA